MDPIRLLGGVNTYSYVGDPLGLMSCSSDAALLRQNMINAEIDVPPFKNSAHHIIMSNSSDQRMVILRQKMDDMNLDINEYYNGVFCLPHLELNTPLEQNRLLIVKSIQMLISKMFMTD